MNTYFSPKLKHTQVHDYVCHLSCEPIHDSKHAIKDKHMHQLLFHEQ